MSNPIFNFSAANLIMAHTADAASMGNIMVRFLLVRFGILFNQVMLVIIQTIIGFVSFDAYYLLKAIRVV